MTSLVAAGRRVLPRGYLDFARQLAIWFGFYVALPARPRRSRTATRRPRSTTASS